MASGKTGGAFEKSSLSDIFTVATMHISVDDIVPVACILEVATDFVESVFNIKAFVGREAAARQQLANPAIALVR
ncbi:MAG: hypothetical protein KAJ86_00145 [Alphaproteobacteria bacterium]|nr:hypothetical protein [Alphaproteobacteria bacterium]